MYISLCYFDQCYIVMINEIRDRRIINIVLPAIRSELQARKRIRVFLRMFLHFNERYVAACADVLCIKVPATKLYCAIARATLA